jgi:hypothetical protein
LWAWVDDRCRPKARTVVVAHNLAYDLRICRAFTLLPQMGWELTDVNLGRQRTFAKWKRDGRSLVMVDSYAWLPTSLEQIGAWCGIDKLALPDWADDDRAWIDRCRRDTEILSAATRRLVDWVRADDLGNWRPTGAGQAWSAFRHRFMAHRLLAHDDDDARTAERVSAWTGRCEVWRWGRGEGGPFSEWDYSAAYANVGADCELPVRLAGHAGQPSAERWHALTAKFAVLADVTVTTQTPTLPTRVDGRIVWPVGTFRTTVWENELSLALDHGADVTFHEVWWYRREPVLRDFCRWVLGVMRAREGCFDPVIVAAIKHWSRALIGRFGARWSEWQTYGEAPEEGLELCRVVNGSTGERYDLLHVGRTLKRETSKRESPDAVVSVMAWVMAECRVRLWRLTELAGPEHVWYMDTDGLIVDAEGSARLELERPAGLRLKGQWADVEILAPRQIILSSRLRAAGVPRTAVRVGESTWEGDVWETLTTALRASEADSVRISRRRVNISGRDARREHGAGGQTWPLVVG